MQHSYNDDIPILSDDGDDFFMINFHDQVDIVTDTEKESESEIDFRKSKNLSTKNILKKRSM